MRLRRLRRTGAAEVGGGGGGGGGGGERRLEEEETEEEIRCKGGDSEEKASAGVRTRRETIFCRWRVLVG
jgi:hypothetical protein